MNVVTIKGQPCAFRVIGQALRPSARNPQPGWMSQCQHPRCLGHWRTGLATEQHALDAYAGHECDERHMALHPGCFPRPYLTDNSHVRIEGYRGKPPGHEEDEMIETATTPEASETTAPEQPEETKGKSKKAGKLTPCYCRTFEAGVDTETPDGQPDVTIETTGCDRMTNRTFAQGHDAKLVSFLVAAELAGKDIRYGRDNGMVSTTDAIGAAKMVSDELAGKTATALANGRNKQAKTNERKAAKAERGAERAAALQAKLDAKEAAAEAKELAALEAKMNQTNETPSVDEVQVTNIPEAKVAGKVGRHEYRGTVDEAGSFHYVNGRGEECTIATGKWTPIAS